MFPLQRPLIAPFWADCDTRRNGSAWFGDHSDQLDQLQKAKQNANKYFCLKDFEPNILFVATWDQVPYFKRRSNVSKVCEG